MSTAGQEPSVTFAYSSAPRLHIDGITPAADGSVHLCLIGELDQEETDRLHAGITDLAHRYASAPIHIDATRLTFLDSAGIRALLICRKRLEQAGSRMSMPRVHPHVFQVLQITGLLDVFGVTEQTAGPAGEPTGHADEFIPAASGDEREAG
ncbi:Anti-sigma F factor antagonist [Actinoplanes sp. SE50/110]|nr:Anti-sigma F factor antagonist [Actinoplanes sp. SE50/110]SLL98946.1 anti-sigma F factor antagonist [Actinoplanes sp. SE50/110]